VDKDCEFLEQEKIMDYSLLVGVHFRGKREIPICRVRYLVKIQYADLLFTWLKVPSISMVKNLQHLAFQDGIGITFFLIQTGNVDTTLLVS
jgi:hypothetical protein